MNKPAIMPASPGDLITNIMERDHAAEGARHNPNISQRAASAPDASVWVAASAGTGKTKVLTDRVLRLLLPRKNGQAGTPPERILCLTFTKAGASEMRIRINDRLGEWATMGEEKLRKALSDLSGHKPGKGEMDAARRLFARVVDTPGGLKIMTIHSFCQSVLGRFPLEAGLPPGFAAIDDGQAAAMLTQARDSVLTRARKEQESDVGRALSRLAAEQNEEQFAALLKALSSERHQLQEMLKSGSDGLRAKLDKTLGLNAGETAQSILAEGCADESFENDAMWAACRALAQGTPKTDAVSGIAMQAWLERDIKGRAQNFADWRGQFIKKGEDEPYKDLMTKGLAARFPSENEAMAREAQRILALEDRVRAAQIAELTHLLLILGGEILREYTALKDFRGALDFDDLIIRTRDLLKKQDMAQWVLYKLDGGIDHVLIDEAQDTNPEQWDIIEALVDNFFGGDGARDITRTLFTVGDEKQSIYSFQRAAPKKFLEKYEEFSRKVIASGQKWEPVRLRVSFRTVSAVLDFVDSVFAQNEARGGLGQDTLEHISFRHAHAGLVEIWPPFKAVKADKSNVWDIPTTVESSANAPAILADFIAQKIKGWTDGREMLPSKGRAVEPGDVLILVKNRTAFVGHMIRALKKHNVPVTGVDRMVLNDQIAVQDLVAVAQAALLPQDDLTLACILKSPLIGWDDARLERVALSRKPGESLWDAVREDGDEKLLNWLASRMREAGSAHPYEFFSQILQEPCPADSISGLHAISARLGDDALDPLDEFLSQALSFEIDHMPALQSFLVWQEQANTSIKREQGEAGGKVRIMTVHASKGLQAPIVILPDTIHGAGRTRPGGLSDHRLLWNNKTDLPVPLWSPRKDMDSRFYAATLAAAEMNEQDEYRRLLYVAITRAEDRLYICGHEGGKAPAPGCWYNLMAGAFNMMDAQEEEFTPPAHLDFGDAPPKLRRIECAQVKDVKQKDDAKQASPPPDMDAPEFAWVRKAPPEEPQPPRPLVPSRPSISDEEDPPAQSPLAQGDAYRFRRGNITHRLLQTLPGIAEARQEETARLYVSRSAADLPEAVRESIVMEAMRILRHPDYRDLFGPASQAEVPITGLVGGRLISGQVDRLYISDDAVWIVDYKTNRPPPKDLKDVPAIYRSQLAGYAATLAGIYPGRTIRTFLLWTDGPDLMEVVL